MSRALTTLNRALTRTRRAPEGSLHDRGSVSIEAAILAIPLLALTALAIVAMRIEVARSSVESSAYEASRAASISRSAAQAEADARSAAEASLRQQGLTCLSLNVSVDTSQFSRPLGQPANVVATASCVVRLSDVALPGLPGSLTLRARFTSPLDQYRARS